MRRVSEFRTGGQEDADHFSGGIVERVDILPFAFSKLDEIVLPALVLTGTSGGDGERPESCLDSWQFRTLYDLLLPSREPIGQSDHCLAHGLFR